MPTSDQAREAYRDKLLYALRMRDVPGDRIGEVLAEVEAHVAETGEDPTDAFGPPRQYADQVVGVTGRNGRWHVDAGVVASSLVIAVASFAAVSWTIGGLTALVDGGTQGAFGMPPWAELALGLVVGTAVLTGLVRYTRRREDPVIDPRTGGPTDALPGWVPPAVYVGVFALVVALGLLVSRL